ncbi:acyl-phosphate glycerol 3-phosphate acyltransferase [Methylomonas lenta]|uniref:Acyl-phosphate glycerol 3-phosphate acyltransferase n=1 Tax=Methylomonas lenta TaxID=980561 RepID=A0A177NGW3_9GAMM|nr:lysophospholipid acyltransferase family protein [Methylomonas lenta]MDD2738200.1 lysophospholipid acyltransferase family protein [Methylomonas lenta]OAI17288.1 acyl-phosphate glycerol 3-phosphate acyltransferase [Methylomonas lenta]
MTQHNSSSPKADFKAYLGSTLFYIYVVFSTPIVGLAVLSAFFLPFSVRYKIADIWINYLLYMLKLCCGLTHEVEGLENVPKGQAAIIMSKHQSAWETIALRQIISPQTAVLKKSLLQIPFGGWALATLKPIAIDRSNQKEALKMLLDQGIERLQEGLCVLIFPEGTRVAPGAYKKFNAGGAMLASKSGFPVIPLAHNAGEFWPRNSFLKYPGVIKVKIGPVISTQNKGTKEINAETEEWISQAMKKISAERD